MGLFNKKITYKSLKNEKEKILQFGNLIVEQYFTKLFNNNIDQNINNQSNEENIYLNNNGFPEINTSDYCSKNFYIKKKIFDNVPTVILDDIIYNIYPQTIIEKINDTQHNKCSAIVEYFQYRMELIKRLSISIQKASDKIFAFQNGFCINTNTSDVTLKMIQLRDNCPGLNYIGDIDDIPSYDENKEWIENNEKLKEFFKNILENANDILKSLVIGEKNDKSINLFDLQNISQQITILENKLETNINYFFQKLSTTLLYDKNSYKQKQLNTKCIELGIDIEFEPCTEESINAKKIQNKLFENCIKYGIENPTEEICTNEILTKRKKLVILCKKLDIDIQNCTNENLQQTQAQIAAINAQKLLFKQCKKMNIPQNPINCTQNELTRYAALYNKCEKLGIQKTFDLCTEIAIANIEKLIPICKKYKIKLNKCSQKKINEIIKNEDALTSLAPECKKYNIKVKSGVCTQKAINKAHAKYIKNIEKKNNTEKAKKKSAEKTKKNITEKAKRKSAEKTKKNIFEKAKQKSAEKTKIFSIKKAKQKAAEKTKRFSIEKDKQKSTEKTKRFSIKKTKNLFQKKNKKKSYNKSSFFKTNKRSRSRKRKGRKR